MPAKRKPSAKTKSKPTAKPKPTSKSKPRAAKPKPAAVPEGAPTAEQPVAPTDAPVVAATADQPPGAPPPPAPPTSGRNPLLIPLAIVAAVALIAAAVFGYFAFVKKDDPVGVTRTISPKTAAKGGAPAGACGRVTHPEDRAGKLDNPTRHSGQDDTVAEATSQPPTSGIHGGGFASNRTIYDEPQPLGNLVHSMDHGSVIIWHKGLPEDEYKALKEAANRNATAGLGALIVVPYEDMEPKIALTAWGTLMECDGVDGDAIDDFLAEFMATGPEGHVACINMPEDHPRCRA